jgi:ABC-type phosphate transport system substrate-binding protein
VRKPWKRLVAATIAGLAATTALAVGTAGAVPTPPPAFPPNLKTDWIRMGGSDTTYFVMDDLALLYNQAVGCVIMGTPQALDGSCHDTDPSTPGIQPAYQPDFDGDPTANANTDHDVAFGYAPLGSSAGITQLANRGLPGFFVIDVARSSRAPRPADVDGLRFFAFAKDAIPWVRFPGAPAAAVTSLTQTQVRLIFSGCSANATSPQIDLPANGGNGNGVADWGDVGGVTNEPIVVWSAQAQSGTRATFDGFLGSGANSTNCIPNQYKDGNFANGERVIPENIASPIRDANDAPRNGIDCADRLTHPTPCAPRSIFFYSLGRWNQTGGETSILGSINGVAPTEANVLNDSFPFSRFVYNVIRNDTFASGLASNAVRNFVSANGFICRRNSQQAINPLTGVNYGVEVENTIRANGFFPLPEGDTGGRLAGLISKCRAVDTVDVN